MILKRNKKSSKISDLQSEDKNNSNYKNKDFDKKEVIKQIYVSTLIIVLSVGIIVSGFLLLYSEKNNEFFSSISFSNPDDLPVKVKTGNKYDFEYNIKSFSDKNENFDLTSVFTLYELYDTTEGLHSCLKPFRKKVYLSWQNNSNYHFGQLTKDNNSNKLVPDLFINPDPINLISWENYNLEFTLGKSFGEGEFVIGFFSDDNSTRANNRSENKSFLKIPKLNLEPSYYFTFKENKLFFNNYFITNVNLSRQNDKVKVSYLDGLLTLTFNKEIIFSEFFKHNKFGQFGFYSHNMFVGLSQISLYKDKPIEVPDKGNVWDVQLDTFVSYHALQAARKNVEKIFSVNRFYVDNSLNCSSKYSCNLVSEKDYFIEKGNVLDVVKRLKGDIEGRSFFTQTNDENDTIPWNSYKISTTINFLSGNESLFVLFDDFFGVSFSANSVDFLESVDSITKISKLKIENSSFNLNSEKFNESIDFEDLSDNISIIIDKNSITVFFRGETFRTNISNEINNASVKFFHHNTYSSVKKVNFDKISSECDKQVVYDFCHIIYPYHRGGINQNIPESQFVSVTKQRGDSISLKTIINSIANQNLSDQVNNRLNDVLNNISKIGNENDNNTPNHLLNNSKNFFTSKIFSFDGPLARIKNQTNITFGFNFWYLDGSEKIGFSFVDDSYEKVIDVIVKPISDEVIITFNEKGVLKNLVVPFDIPEDSWVPVQLFIGKDIIEVRVNKTTIAAFENINIKDGFFQIEITDTYAEIENAYLIYHGEVDRTRRLPISDDPCQLKPIFEKEIRNEHFSLDKNSFVDYFDEIYIDREFDYGKLSVSLVNSDPNKDSDAPLEIHSWMVRE